MKTVLICGGRGYTDEAAVHAAIVESEATIVVHGDYPTGADALADKTARRLGLIVLPEKARWSEYGDAAGPARNRLMLEKYRPQLVIAFPGGRGTKDMIRQARAFSVPVWRRGV